MNYLWVLALICSSIAGAWYANLANTCVPHARIGVFVCGMIGIGIWTYVASTSRHLVFDSLVYDLVLTLVFTICLIYLQNLSQHFTVLNWIGAGLALLGLVCLKL